MQHALQIIKGSAQTLPILATADDVREVVQLLKKKPEGITIIEASNALRKRLFDPRKVAAYELWGIMCRDGDRIKLSDLGHDFATRLEPEVEIYRTILNNTSPYRAVLEWIYERDLDLVTYAEITEYWRNNFPEVLHRDEKTREAHVVSFFHVCQAAQIGRATAGRKGQPSRLRVDHDELASYIEGNHRQVSERAIIQDAQLDTRQLAAVSATSSQRRCVFISTPTGIDMVDSIRDALRIADIESEVVERQPVAGKLVPECTYEAMRRCHAGVIIVSGADFGPDAAGKSMVNQNVLIEIGAALVHFARRLVLLREQDIALPFNLDDFCHDEFDGSKLTWETGLRLIKTVKAFYSLPCDGTPCLFQ